MAPGTATPRGRVNGFPIDDSVLFKHYFEGEAVFDRLKPYYNGSQYRFEVPVEAFDSLRRFLRDHGYDVQPVDRPDDFYVAVPQYSEHPEGIFKDSVHHQRTRGYNCFLMKDRRAIEEAVAGGAERLASTSLTLHQTTIGDFARPSP